jgi:hypothetical protein
MLQVAELIPNVSNWRRQIKQPPSSPSPANQNLKWDVFRQKFCKLGHMTIFRDGGWDALKISLNRDVRARPISEHILIFQTFRPL